MSSYSFWRSGTSDCPRTISSTSARFSAPPGLCSSTHLPCTASGSTACTPLASVDGMSEPALRYPGAVTLTCAVPNGLRPLTVENCTPCTVSWRAPPARPGTGVTRSVSAIANGSPLRCTAPASTSTGIRSASIGTPGILPVYHLAAYSNANGMPGPSSSAAMNTNTKLVVLSGLVIDAENVTSTVCASSGLSCGAM
ncbi:hypothetical protein C1Y40_03199 [Mycobacterium talmoniae]|uniref:Uncharacterized protein n=1 Tax=Mycobacterium talmoniae TaxID=1858794 RepID=A0A2S8BIV7_9MYCO|nr:hypothetical protein C1Y40_03199 [Mycobacterium talmoniae]